VTLDPSTGTVSGSPTTAGSYSITIQVKDSGAQIATKQFDFAVLATAPATTVSGQTAPRAQANISFDLGGTATFDTSVTLGLSFTPSAGLVNDPMIQFVPAGGRSFTFSVPKNSRTVSNIQAIQTGTVAGTITLTITTLAGYSTNLPPLEISIPASLPVTTMPPTISKTGTSFTVSLKGYSTPRNIQQAKFEFAASPGFNLQTTCLLIPLNSQFTSWYASPTSTQSGSQFSLQATFNVVGDINAVGSVTAVTLSNTLGPPLSCP